MGEVRRLLPAPITQVYYISRWNNRGEYGMSLIQLYHESGKYSAFTNWFTKNSRECCVDLPFYPNVAERVLGELSQCVGVCTYNYKKNRIWWD